MISGVTERKKNLQSLQERAKYGNVKRNQEIENILMSREANITSFMSSLI